ncbi:hypothetical protein HOD75_02255 [archaeon]|nr:hypothetical protein [archaeon]MBT4241700.1 hypothetical protein [archaeon]MBT4418248.1 hypothetical protein [archaeon]
MNSKKSLVLGLLVIGIFGISISLVSAGFVDNVKDFFKFGDDSDLEGELAASKDVSLEVSGALPIPEIVYISDIEFTEMAGGGMTDGGGNPSILHGLLDSTPGNIQFTTKRFEMYVYSSAGVSAFDSFEEAYVTLVYTPGNNLLGTTSEDIRKGANCVFNRDIGSYNTNTDDIGEVNIGSVPVRVFRCDVEAKFFDDYGANKWRVEGYIRDRSSNEEGYKGLGDVYPNAQSQPVRNTYYELLHNRVLSPSDALEFGIIGFGEINERPTNGPLMVQNTGNVAIANTEITARDIPGADTINDFPANLFYTDPTNPCIVPGAIQLEHDIAKNANLGIIQRGTSSSNALNLCIDTVPGDVVSQVYSTESTANSWEVDTFTS